MGDKQILNDRNEELVGFLHEAKNGDEKDLVIVCHGYNSDHNDRIIKKICNSLPSVGYDAFRFTFSGYKKSGEIHADPSFKEQYSDLRSVLDHFQKKYKTISVVGHSTGGTIAILVAAYDYDRRIKSIVLMAPRIYPSKSTMTRKIEQKYGGTVAELLKDPQVKYPVEVEIHGESHQFSKIYVEELAKLDVARNLKRINCPLLILHGDDDKVVDIEEGKTAEMEVRKLATFFPVSNADHSMSCNEHLKEAIKIISTWFSQQKQGQRIKLKGRRKANHLFENSLAKQKGRRLRRPTIKKRILLLFILSLLVVFLFGRGCLPNISYSTQGGPEMPTQGDNKKSEEAEREAFSLAVWWAVLALISTLTLTYVTLINRLRDKLPKLKPKIWNFDKEQKIREISWNMVLLSWAAFLMFITISGIALRILYSYTKWYLPIPIWKDSNLFLADIDSIILYSFIVSTLLRIWLFLDSHWEDLFIYLFVHRRSKKKKRSFVT